MVPDNFSQLARQCNIGNSCNHEHILFAARGGEEDICRNNNNNNNNNNDNFISIAVYTKALYCFTI